MSYLSTDLFDFESTLTILNRLRILIKHGGLSGISTDPIFEREFRMEFVELDISESEGLAEFPEVESVEKTSPEKSVVNKNKTIQKRRYKTVATEDKST